jgi:hypothetical protein
MGFRLQSDVPAESPASAASGIARRKSPDYFILIVDPHQKKMKRSKQSKYHHLHVNYPIKTVTFNLWIDFFKFHEHAPKSNEMLDFSATPLRRFCLLRKEKPIRHHRR